MAVHELKLGEIDNVDDGRVTVAWQQALKRAVADIEDRPAVGDARKVVLQTELVPTLDQDGQLDTIKVQFQIKDTVPTRKTKKYDMQSRRGQQLVFNDLSDDNVHQRTLDEMEGAE